MPTLASTIFQTAAHEDVAAVDIYTQKSAAEPIDAAASPDTDPFNVAGFLGQDPQLVGNLDIAAVTTTTLIPPDISTAVLQAQPDLQSCYANLDKSVQQQLTAVAPDISALSHVQDLSLPTLTGTLSATLSSKNITALSGMLDVAGKQAVGSLLVTPTAAQATFMSNLLKVSVNAGIPNAYARIDAGNYGAKVMAQVTKAGLSAAVSTSNLNLLANLSNGSMAASIKGMAPGFIGQFAANFKLTSGTSPASHPQIAADLSSAFGKIDAQWGSQRNGAGNAVVNASLFVGASKDFQTVMKAAVTFSRKPLASHTTINANIAATLLPLPTALPPNTVYRTAPSAHGLTQSFTAGDGSVSTYVPNADGTFNQTSVTPALLDSSSWGSLDNSSVDDPMALAALHGQCLANSAQASSSSGQANPTLDAAASLNTMFPLAYLGDLATAG